MLNSSEGVKPLFLENYECSQIYNSDMNLYDDMVTGNRMKG